MKKLIGVMSALVAAVGLTACGGEEQPVKESKAAEEQVVESEVADEQVVESEFVTKQFGDISVNVPSTFTDVKEQDGMYLAGGEGASVTVALLPEIERLPSEWDESVAQKSLEAYSPSYSNMELAAYEGNLELNGNPAVYYSFYGTYEENELLSHVIYVFNTDLTAQYVISYTHLADDESYTEDVSLAIINSITLSEQ